MNCVGKRYYYDHNSTMVVLRNYRIHYGPPGFVTDYYDVVIEYENGQKKFQRKNKNEFDKQTFSQANKFIEKVGTDTIAKYLLLEEKDGRVYK